LTAKLVFSETDGQQIYYVGKHGNDSDDGLTINRAFLTFGAAIAAAVAAVPGAANRFVIYCEDDGIYSEAITVPQYVDVHAANAKITSAAGAGLGTGTVLIAADCTVTFREIEQTSAAALSSAVVRTNTVGTGKVVAETVRVSNQTIGIFNIGFTNGAVLMAEVKQVFVDTGWGVGDASSDQGHTHIDIEDIYIGGTSGTGISRFSTGSTVGRVSHILETGSPLTTTGLFCSNGSLDLVIGTITMDTAWNIAAGGTLHLLIDTVTGTRTEVGTALVTEAGYIRETSGPTNLTPAAITDTELLRRSGTTIDSIAGSSLTGMDHGLLNAASLLDDDHANYLYLPGRVGGQVAIGGTIAANVLTLQDNVANANQITFGTGINAGLLDAQTGGNDIEARHMALGVSRTATDSHSLIITQDYAGTVGTVVGVGIFNRVTPGVPVTTSQAVAVQGNQWFDGSNWQQGGAPIANSQVRCLDFYPAPAIFGASWGAPTLDIGGIGTAGLLNVANRAVVAENITGIGVAPIAGIFGNDNTTAQIVLGIKIAQPITTTGLWGRLCGLQIEPQTEGLINQGLWMMGDGIGSDLCLGAGDGTGEIQCTFPPDNFAFAVGVVTLTDFGGAFTAAMVGRTIHIKGATTAGNNGTFVIASFIGATQVTWANAAGAAEAFTGTYSVTGKGDACIYYDGSDLIVDPDALTAGDRVYIGATGDDDMLLNDIEIGGNAQFGADVVLTRGAANRLDFAAGDSLRLSSTGTLQFIDTAAQLAATATGNLTATVYRLILNGFHSYTSASPAQITADQNDYALPSAGSQRFKLRLSTDAARTITGIAIQVDGDAIYIINVGANNLVLAHQNVASAAANRMISPTGADLTLGADEYAYLWYDDVTLRWRILETNGA